MFSSSTTATDQAVGTTPATPTTPPTTFTSSPETWLPATETAVAEIAEIPDVAVRNLWITQAYADFSDRLARVIATDHTWCTFAVWASNTAGQSIREEELGATLDALIGDGHHTAAADANHVVRWLRRLGLVRALEATHIDDLVRSSVDVVSDHIAHGNTLVFSELAPLFVRFLEAFESGQAPAGGGDALLTRMGLDPTSDDHVVRAFRLYFEAAHESFSTVRAQKVLAANIWAVLHEQQRLQADIAASLDSGFIAMDDLIASHVHRWLPDIVSERLVRRILDVVETPVRDLFESVATDLMMKLYVPGAVLRLGHTLPPLPNGEMFSEALAVVEVDSLAEALGEWDGTDGTGLHCGAGDWAELHERMTYIVNLFRSRQHTTSLRTAPFTDEQLAAMRGLQLPEGPLLPS